MNETLTAYFEGEKNAGLVLAALGMIALVSAALMFPERFGLRALGATLAVFALLELTIGLGLYFKTGPQVEKLEAQLAADPKAFTEVEKPRMEAVQRNFRVLELTWLGLIAISAPAAFFFKEHTIISGIALGVLMNVTVVLTFDIIAERRGAIYLEAINQAAST
jgi:hypothetical protein